MVGRTYLKIGLVVLFGVFAVYFGSLYQCVGNTEALSFLSRKASLVTWPEIRITEDSFANWDSQKSGLVKNFNERPAVYFKGSSTIIPVMVQERTGALPHLFIRFLALIGSSLSLILFTLILNLVTLLSPLLILKNNSERTLAYLVIATLSPFFFYGMGASFPDATASTFLLVVMMTLASGQFRHAGILMGLLAGLCLYLKVSSVIFFPFVLITNWNFFRAHYRKVLIAFVPILIGLCFLSDLDTAVAVVTERSRISMRQLSFVPEGVVTFFGYLTDPGELFGLIGSQVIDGMGRFASFKNPVHVALTILSTLTTGFIFWAGLTRKQLLIFTITLISVLFVSCYIAASPEEPLLSYYTQIAVLMFAYLAFHLKPSKNVAIALMILLILKVAGTFRFHENLMHLSRDFKGCVWTYDCLVPELKDKHPLFGVAQMDQGQLEFFSGGAITPVHLRSKHYATPTQAMLNDFLKSYPDGFFLLASEGKTLVVEGWKSEVLKEFNFPTLDRDYKILKFTRHNP